MSPEAAAWELERRSRIKEQVREMLRKAFIMDGWNSYCRRGHIHGAAGIYLESRQYPTKLLRSLVKETLLELGVTPLIYEGEKIYRGIRINPEAKWAIIAGNSLIREASVGKVASMDRARAYEAATALGMDAATALKASKKMVQKTLLRRRAGQEVEQD